MTAESFREWRYKRGLSERRAAELLGVSRGFIKSCEESGAPLYIALAVAAVEASLEPHQTKIAPEDFRRVE